VEESHAILMTKEIFGGLDHHWSFSEPSSHARLSSCRYQQASRVHQDGHCR